MSAPATESGPFLNASDIQRAIVRIAHEILERNRGAADVVLLGIPTRGVGLARRISAAMQEIEGMPVPAGELDVTMYRDDLRLRPTVPLHPTVIPGDDVTDQIVVLVDDVLFSGRTVRAAMDALGEVGRPRAVQLAVLVDRGHREFPIRADYVGKNVPTQRGDDVQVQLAETDGVDEVRLIRHGGK